MESHIKELIEIHPNNLNRAEGFSLSKFRSLSFKSWRTDRRSSLRTRNLLPYFNLSPLNGQHL